MTHGTKRHWEPEPSSLVVADFSHIPRGISSEVNLGHLALLLLDLSGSGRRQAREGDRRSWFHKCLMSAACLLYSFPLLCSLPRKITCKWQFLSLSGSPARDGNRAGVFVQALGFNGTIPGPVIVVHEGDYVELTLRNPASNAMGRNIDFQASTGATGSTLEKPGVFSCRADDLWECCGSVWR